MNPWGNETNGDSRSYTSQSYFRTILANHWDPNYTLCSQKRDWYILHSNYNFTSLYIDTHTPTTCLKIYKMVIYWVCFPKPAANTDIGSNCILSQLPVQWLHPQCTSCFLHSTPTLPLIWFGEERHWSPSLASWTFKCLSARDPYKNSCRIVMGCLNHSNTRALCVSGDVINRTPSVTNKAVKQKETMGDWSKTAQDAWAVAYCNFIMQDGSDDETHTRAQSRRLSCQIN